MLPLRVRGLERVQLRADLTVLAKLACALEGANRSARSLAVSIQSCRRTPDRLIAAIK